MGRVAQGLPLDVVAARRRNVGVVAVPPPAVRVRAPNARRARLEWGQHLANISENDFQSMYRMPKGLFHHLCELLRPSLERDSRMAQRSSPHGVIVPEIQLLLALRFFSGASYLDVAPHYGVHRSTFFAVMWRVVNAINDVLRLAGLPVEDGAALRQMSLDFQKERCNPLSGCVGALDGVAIEIRKPSKECADPEWFLNRKGFYAIPLQVVCDARQRFTYASIVCAGSTTDATCFAASSLGKIIHQGSFPSGFWIAADEGYPASRAILTPWPGQNLLPEQDSLNFWLSSLRINIEQALGMLAMRWGILWRRIDLDYRKVPRLLMALLKLHNLCIDHKAPLTNQPPADLQPQDRVRLHFQSNRDVVHDIHWQLRHRPEDSLRGPFTESLRAAGILPPSHVFNEEA